jgi:hypothetical protein
MGTYKMECDTPGTVVWLMQVSSEELWNIMEWYDEADSFIYTDFFAFQQQHKWPWQNIWKIWPWVEKMSLMTRMLNIAVKIIVLLRGWIIFKQYVLKKHKQFGLRITVVYLGR